MKARKQPYVWMMVREAMAALNGRATRRDIRHWVLREYPGTNAGTIGCQTTVCTVNNPQRVAFNQNMRPRTQRNQYDFIFALDDDTLISYVPRDHGHWIIALGDDGQLLVQRADEPETTRKIAFRLHIFYCGNPSENNDYAILSNLAANGGCDDWASLKAVNPGDRILFYTVHGRQAFMASGWALGSSLPTGHRDKYRYRTPTGAVRIMARPVPIALVREKFPAWRWHRFTRNITTVPPSIAQALWEFVHTEGESVAASEPETAALPAPKFRNDGGFGDAKRNKIVEMAAILAVKRELRKRGFAVRSRESENIGYDLDARKGTDVWHIEVKGVSGSSVSFNITSNELATARCDAFFKLIVVNRAATANPKLTEFKGSDLDNEFDLAALSYSAVKRL